MLKNDQQQRRNNMLLPSVKRVRLPLRRGLTAARLKTLMDDRCNTKQEFTEANH